MEVTATRRAGSLLQTSRKYTASSHLEKRKNTITQFMSYRIIYLEDGNVVNGSASLYGGTCLRKFRQPRQPSLCLLQSCKYMSSLLSHSSACISFNMPCMHLGYSRGAGHGVCLQLSIFLGQYYWKMCADTIWKLLENAVRTTLFYFIFLSLLLLLLFFY